MIVLLAAYSVFALVAGGPFLSTRLAGVGYGLTYVSNWPQAFGLTFPEQELGFLWTLAIEEQYYLLWPSLLLLALHVGRLSPRRLIVAIFCVVVAVWIWRIVLVDAGVEGRRIYFGTDTRLDQLLLGAALAAWFVRRSTSAAGSLALRLGGWAGVAFLTWRLFDPGVLPRVVPHSGACGHRNGVRGHHRLCGHELVLGARVGSQLALAALGRGVVLLVVSLARAGDSCGRELPTRALDYPSDSRRHRAVIRPRRSVIPVRRAAVSPPPQAIRTVTCDEGRC